MSDTEKDGESGYALKGLVASTPKETGTLPKMTKRTFSKEMEDSAGKLNMTNTFRALLAEASESRMSALRPRDVKGR